MVCQNGEISPNMVTLAVFPHYLQCNLQHISSDIVLWRKVLTKAFLLRAKQFATTMVIKVSAAAAVAEDRKKIRKIFLL